MRKITIFVFVAALLAAPVAWSYDQGDWYVRVGATKVDPDDPNGDIDLSAVDPAIGIVDIEVDDAWGMTFTVSYQWRPNWAFELLAAYPYDHDIKLPGVGDVGETSHIPPTLSVQYHFLPDGTFQPYIGAGLNYTIFFDDEESGVLEDLGGSLSIEDNSFGPAAQVGFDWMLNERWFLNADLRYIAIDTEAEVTIPDVGTIKEDVDVDPWVYGFSVGYRFGK